MFGLSIDVIAETVCILTVFGLVFMAVVIELKIRRNNRRK